ncbi:MAG: NADH-quinone oxidoreductase subunit N, partial [Rhizobiales bacterium]|nr:NADH-quinone oxidoreductase subunit N [Hyphomicrobiales bacterium]
MNALPDFLPALPEIILAVGAMVLLLVGAFGGQRSMGVVCWGSIGLLLVALVVLHTEAMAGSETFGGSFILDEFAVFMKSLTLVGSAAVLMMSAGYMKAIRLERFEFPVLIV